eukprot:3249643-Amphidinium_carterae.1
MVHDRNAAAVCQKGSGLPGDIWSFACVVRHESCESDFRLSLWHCRHMVHAKQNHLRVQGLGMATA